MENSILIKFMKMSISDKKTAIIHELYPFFLRAKYGNIGKQAYIDHPISIINGRDMFFDDYVTIGHGARIECIENWNGEKYKPHISIGRGVSIGQNFHAACANRIEIGNDVVISSNVFISDNEHDINIVDRNLFSKDLIVKDIHIGDFSFIGTGTIILAGANIGKNCVVGANSIIKSDIPNETMVVGMGRVVKKYDRKNHKWISIKQD